MKLKCIAIDDEEAALENLAILIERYIPEVELVAVSQNIIDGIKEIKKHKPDLVFLDVSMPQGGGFDLLDIIGEIDFDFVFVTAHEEYSIRAIRKSASDFILKPIDIDELRECVLRVLKNTINTKKVALDNKIIISTKEGLEFIKVDDVIRLEAQKSYCYLFLESRESILVTKSLSELKKKLPPILFQKCHRAHLINLSKVKKYKHEDGGHIFLTDDIAVPVSSSKKNEILELLKNI